MIWLYVGLGGAVGAMARYGWMASVGKMIASGFPYGILSANILGSFLMGLLTGLAAHYLNISHEMRAFLAVGVLGSFTTFSTFSLDTATLIGRGEHVQAVTYILLSVSLSILALYGGLMLARI